MGYVTSLNHYKVIKNQITSNNSIPKVNSSLISSVRLLREKGESIRDISKTFSIGVETTMKIVKEHRIELIG